MTNKKKTIDETKDIYLKCVRAYRKQYNEQHPEKVKQWRKNAIVNAYKKLIAAEPQYKIWGGCR